MERRPRSFERETRAEKDFSSVIRLRENHRITAEHTRQIMCGTDNETASNLRQLQRDTLTRMEAYRPGSAFRGNQQPLPPPPAIGASEYQHSNHLPERTLRSAFHNLHAIRLVRAWILQLLDPNSSQAGRER